MSTDMTGETKEDAEDISGHQMASTKQEEEVGYENEDPPRMEIPQCNRVKIALQTRARFMSNKRYQRSGFAHLIWILSSGNRQGIYTRKLVGHLRSSNCCCFYLNSFVITLYKNQDWWTLWQWGYHYLRLLYPWKRWIKQCLLFCENRFAFDVHFWDYLLTYLDKFYYCNSIFNYYICYLTDHKSFGYELGLLKKKWKVRWLNREK